MEDKELVKELVIGFENLKRKNINIDKAIKAKYFGEIGAIIIKNNLNRALESDYDIEHIYFMLENSKKNIFEKPFYYNIDHLTDEEKTKICKNVHVLYYLMTGGYFKDNEFNNDRNIITDAYKRCNIKPFSNKYEARKNILYKIKNDQTGVNDYIDKLINYMINPDEIDLRKRAI